MYNYTSIVVQDKQLFARVFIRPTSVSYSILCPVIGSFRKMASFVRCWKLSTNKLTENCRCSSLSMPILYIIYIYMYCYSLIEWLDCCRYNYSDNSIIGAELMEKYIFVFSSFLVSIGSSAWQQITRKRSSKCFFPLSICLFLLEVFSFNNINHILKTNFFS